MGFAAAIVMVRVLQTFPLCKALLCQAKTQLGALFLSAIILQCKQKTAVRATILGQHYAATSPLHCMCKLECTKVENTK